MNKNISRASLVVFMFILFSSSINGSALDPYLAIINADTNAVAAALSRAKDQAHNDFILHGASSLDQQFQIALCAGRYDYLSAMPNKKNWLSNMFFSNKYTQYINDYINREVDPNTQDSPLHLAVRIAGYHRNNAVQASQEKRVTDYNLSTHKLHQMQQTILFLIEHGANVNAQNRKGETPLHLAYKAPEFQSAHILVESHANPMAEDNLGKMPFTYLDKSKTKNEQEYLNFKKEYYNAYNIADKKNQQHVNNTLAKVKIVDCQPIIQNQPVKNKPVYYPRVILKDNIAEVTNSTTSERTASDRSSQLSDTPAKINRRTTQQEVNPPSKNHDSFAVSSQPTPIIKNKPRPATAGSVSTRKTAVINSTATTTISPDHTYNTTEVVQQVTKTRTTVKPSRPAQDHIA